MRIALSLLLLLCPISALAADQLTERDARITRIVRAGGVLTFDNKKPEKPPIKLVLEVRKALSKEVTADILRLETIRAVHVSALVGSDENLEWASSLPNLIVLHCSRTDDAQVSIKGMSHLAAAQKLEILDLSALHLTDQEIAPLGKLSRLTELNLATTDITDRGLAHLKECRSLRVLNVEHTDIIGPGFKELKPLPKLELLALGGNKIDDTSIASLIGCSELAGLSLNSVAITDIGLRHVEKMDGLKRLIISGSSSLSEEGIRTLQKKRPRLMIEWYRKS